MSAMETLETTKMRAVAGALAETNGNVTQAARVDSALDDVV